MGLIVKGLIQTVTYKIGWLDPTILQKPELLKVRRRFYLYVFDLGLMERYCCLLSLLVQYVFSVFLQRFRGSTGYGDSLWRILISFSLRHDHFRPRTYSRFSRCLSEGIQMCLIIAILNIQITLLH